MPPDFYEAIASHGFKLQPTEQVPAMQRFLSRREFLSGTVFLPIRWHLGAIPVAEGILFNCQEKPSNTLDRYWEYIDPEVRYRIPAPPANESSWPLWEKMLEAYSPYPESIERHLFYGSGSFEIPVDPGRKELDRWLDDNRLAFSLLEQALDSDKFQLPSVEPKKAFRPQVLDLLRNAYALISGRAVLSLAEKNLSKVSQLIESLHRLARMVASTHLTLYEFEISQSIAQNDLVRMWWAVANPGPKWAERILALLDEYPPNPAYFRRAARVEYCYVELLSLDTINKGFEKQGIESLVPTIYPEPGGELDLFTNFRMERERLRKGLPELFRAHAKPFDMVETVKLTSQVYRILIEDSATPWVNRLEALGNELEKEIQAWPKALRFFEASWSSDQAPRDPTAEELARARQSLSKVENPVGKLFTAQIAEIIHKRRYSFMIRVADWNATRIILALHLYHNKHDVYPDKLSALVDTGIMPAIPQDPFSGEPLKYDKRKGVIWSVGSTGKFDARDYSLRDSAFSRESPWWRL